LARIIFLAKLALTAGLLTYIAIKIDLSAVWVQARILLAIGTLVLALQPLLGAVRWQFILYTAQTSMRSVAALRWTYISIFFSQVLPATAGGDVLRIWLAHRGGCSMRSAVNGVGLDRAAMLLSLVLLLAFSAPYISALIEADRLLVAVPLLAAGGVTALGLLMLGDRLPQPLQRYRAVRAVGYLAQDARRLFLNPVFALAAVALSLISFLNIIVSVYFFAWAFGSSTDLLQMILLVPPVLLASTLPISVGGWGTRELAMVTVLGAAGVSADTAVLASIWLGIASVVIALPGGVIFLFGGSRQLDAPEQATIPANS
jgi:uncharacterized membrane protein YbhN (UPF0104 family)